MNESTRKKWNDRSDAYYAENDHERDIAIIMNDPSRAFPREAWEMLQSAIPDLRGKRVLVPSSGDNIAVFGFHLLEAQVTSTDIAERQLENAAKIAGEHGWDIEFRQADSMTLEGIPENEYDLIFTSNGAHVWISDLGMMYRAFHRALKPGGAYVFFETHPICRPFDRSGNEAKIVKPYTSTGPFDDPPHYTWRIEDFLRPLLDTGFSIQDYRDMMPDKDDIMAFAWHYKTYAAREQDNYAEYAWEKNIWATLPCWMGVSARKREA